MPQMDGMEATKILRDMGYTHPIVALTANAVSGQAILFLENGFDEFISKPIDLRHMNVVLNKLIRDKQPPEIIKAARMQAVIKKEQLPKDLQQPDYDPQLVEVFLRDALKSIAVLEILDKKQGSYDDDDVRTYVIHVHGLKVALASIGKTELSAVALKLEILGRDNNIKAMSSEISAFLNSLRTLVEELTPEIVTKSSETADEGAYLYEKLLAVKTACEEYDDETIDDIVVKLREKTWSQPTQELLSTIAKHVLHSDFDEIVKDVDKYYKYSDLKTSIDCKGFK